MTQATCGLCARPMPDTAYVCPACTRKVGEDLERIVEYGPEVEAAVLKLVRYGASGKASGERPVPFDDTRAQREAAVGNTLATWAMHVAESRGVPIPRPPDKPVVFGPLCFRGGALSWFLDSSRTLPCPHGSCEEIRPARRPLGAAVAAAWLAQREQLEWLRHQPEAVEAMAELRDAARELQRVVDRPRDLWYAGPCWQELGDGIRCPNELYVAPGKAMIRCKECGAEWDTAKRKEWLLREARDTLAHAALISAALTALGMPVAVGTVYSWASRGRIVAHGSDGLGRPLYRVGEAIDLLSQPRRRVA